MAFVFLLLVITIAGLLGNQRIRNMFNGIIVRFGFLIVLVIAILPAVFGDKHEESFLLFGEMCIAIVFAMIVRHLSRGSIVTRKRRSF